MKRKMIKNCLSGLVCSKELENLEVPPTGRAEQISVGKFVEIANFIYKKK
jgi:16S rRNA A1518/A1519 N6-dimethyltransferase RsmA/KsgA/DIM1 with predicted DNA glycosylase/AP lyase activity